ncbi:MAG: hypothetical protein AABZ12_11445 [Planctomycetota bacterium]
MSRCALVVGACFGWVGCHKAQPVEPVSTSNRVLGFATVAVAPAINLSGSTDFDPNRFADLMASELGYADGIRVIPVSRVLGVLAAQGKDRVESASHAGELVQWLGADALLVFAVTEYDPFDPPSVGLSAQLYGTRPRPGIELEGAVQSPALYRLDARPPEQPGVHVLSETQRVFDAAHDSVVADIKTYASRRDADTSPYGWRRYVVSQQDFIRFCCSQTIDVLLNGERPRIASGSRSGK